MIVVLHTIELILVYDRVILIPSDTAQCLMFFNHIFFGLPSGLPISTFLVKDSSRFIGYDQFISFSLTRWLTRSFIKPNYFIVEVCSSLTSIILLDNQTTCEVYASFHKRKKDYT